MDSSTSSSRQVSASLKGRTMKILERELKLVKDFIVDFDSFAKNGYNMRYEFNKHGWMSFFDVLNGPCYTTLVKDFWVRAEIMKGTKEGREMEIRSSVMGIEITISQSTIAKLIVLDNTGFFETDSNLIRSKFGDDIKSTLYKVVEEKVGGENEEDVNGCKKKVDKATNMYDMERILFKFFIQCIFSRVGSTDQPNRIHKVIFLNLHKNAKVNLAEYVFHHLCTTIDNSWRTQHKSIPYPRLLSELFHQSKVI